MPSIIYSATKKARNLEMMEVGWLARNSLLEDATEIVG